MEDSFDSRHATKNDIRTPLLTQESNPSAVQGKYSFYNQGDTNVTTSPIHISSKMQLNPEANQRKVSQQRQKPSVPISPYCASPFVGTTNLFKAS